MRVLGLDVAKRRTGWAVVEGDRVRDVNHFSSRGNSDGELWWSIYGEVDDLITTFGPVAVYAESHRYVSHREDRSLVTSLELAKASAPVAMVCQRKRVPLVSLEVAAWRELFCGSRRAGKVDVQRVVRFMGVELPAEIKKGSFWEDRCDAIGIAAVGYRLEEVKRLEKGQTS